MFYSKSINISKGRVYDKGRVITRFGNELNPNKLTCLTMFLHKLTQFN